MPRKAPTKPSRADELAAKADARLREQGIESEPEEFSLDWYRADWPGRKRIFIENEIKIRNAFEQNREVPLVLNDAQIELHQGSLAASVAAIEAQLWSNPNLFFSGLAIPAGLAPIKDFLKESNALIEEHVAAAMDIIFASTGVNADDLEPNRTDTTLKCRRIGGTTYYEADYLADAIVEGNHNVRLVAHDPDTVSEFLSAVKFMYDHLRPGIKPVAEYDNKGELAFNDPEKKVFSRFSISTVTPGSEEKGRGQTITRLHLTEIPFWKGDRKKAYVALKDAAKGGKVTEESTAGGVGDEFYDDYEKGKQKKAGYRSHFFAWWWNRNYQLQGFRFEQHDGEWFLLKSTQSFETIAEEDRERSRVSTYTAEERLKSDLLLQSEKDCAEQILSHLKVKGYVGADALWHCPAVAAFISWRRYEIEEKGARDFRREYPENDVDPFTQSGGGIFDHSYLIVRAQFRAAVAGHEYKIYLDPSIGVDGGDPFYLTVIDCYSGEQVLGEAGIKKQDWQGQRCCEISDLYNAAEIGIESNMGEAAIQEVERRGKGHRLYKHIDVQTERDIAEGKIKYRDAWLKAKPGLPLTERLKRLHINEFERAWRKGEFKCADPYMIGEAKTFVQEGEKLGAKSGKHDDSISSASGCWYLVIHSRTGSPDFLSTGEKLGSAQVGAY
jgi:hypothetical protein